MSGRILIVDPIAINRIVLRSRVAVSCHNVCQASSAEDTLPQIQATRPDLVLLGPGLGDLTACALTAQLRQDPAARNTPVIILTSKDDPQILRKALKAGAEDALPPSVQTAFLLARIRRLLRQRDALEDLAARSLTDRLVGLAESSAVFKRPGRIALVTTTDITGRAWEAALSPLVSHKILRANPHETLSSLPDAGQIDMFIVQETPDQPDDSLRFLAELRSRRQLRTAAVILVSRPNLLQLPEAETRLAMTLDIGANDILRNGFDAEELALRVEAHIARKQADDRLRDQVSDELRDAVRDPLTGLHNRRFAMPQLSRIAVKAMRGQSSFALMMIDIDRFKMVNDTYGHGVGDTVLVEVATRLREEIRGQDLLARIGGEEFMIAMPDANLPQAQRMADRICHSMRERPVAVDATVSALRVTVSIGLAMIDFSPERPPVTWHDSEQMIRSMMERADRALYGAKSQGRDKVLVERSAA